MIFEFIHLNFLRFVTKLSFFKFLLKIIQQWKFIHVKHLENIFLRGFLSGLILNRLMRLVWKLICTYFLNFCWNRFLFARLARLTRLGKNSLLGSLLLYSWRGSWLLLENCNFLRLSPKVVSWLASGLSVAHFLVELLTHVHTFSILFFSEWKKLNQVWALKLRIKLSRCFVSISEQVSVFDRDVF